ncbi:hypothetical protein [Inconstantimicrobium mannanitabidum]|uniref:Uncharacterized protein n=1 Tax=Inconstantimicrobium mannanitabidum TaxID=1604901 RepID=A0ACB5RA53_9CLOT|nr:hypothetical protein [Clostridium sp. TW13]GKX65916.1 hypothetical protein rsdtw13_11740 [Clostridium sp. TW13]
MDMYAKKSRKKRKEEEDIMVINCYDEEEECCHFDNDECTPKGKVLQSFCFDDNSASTDISKDTSFPMNLSSDINTTNNTTIIDDTKIEDHRVGKANPNGKTPAVDGEAFDMLRSYSLRPSTVRILSKIKAIHKDDNVYLNTIVDEAIRHYYEHLKNVDE